MLLEWNNSDPVDEIEQRRNEQVAKYQGNRNPFIDNSEYANMIWGSGSSSTPTVNSVTVSPTTLNLDLNGTKTGTLTATVSVSNGAAQTVTWESSNTNVATVSSSGVVTAKAKGTCAVTATSTVNSNKSDSCTVKVVDTSGGGGTQNSGSQRVVSKSDSTYFETGSIYFSGNTTSGTASCDAFSVTQTKNSGNNIAYTYNEIRVYQYHTLTFTPNSGYSITSVAITANSNDYASALGGSNLNNCTKTVSNANVTLTPTNQSSAFSFTNSAQSRLNYLVVNYSSESSSTASTLQSISLNTSNVQTEFYVGGTFDYSGLVVTAHYADGTEDIVTPTSVSTPSMSSAGNKTITVSYTENNVTKTETYSISVVAKVITEIVASVNKVYHPGETISSSDITVEDNYGDEVSSFSFSNNNYQFTYADAASGGALTDKVFANAVAGANQVCSLTVQVQRVAHVSDSQFVWTKVVSTSSLTIGDEIIIADSTQNVALSTEQRTSNRAAVSIEKNNGQISWDTTESVVPQELELTSVSGITNAPSGSFGLYTGSGYLYAASSSANQLKTQNNNNINGAFVITIVDGVATISATGSSNRPLMRSNYSNNPSIFSCYAADATTGNPLEIYKKTEVSSETPVNLANYIMYEDTTNQCLTKLNTAVGYLGDLNPEDLSEFAESQDYVILTARTRLNAWALSQGKEIDYSNASMSNRSRVSLFNEQTNNSKTITLILIISILGVSSVGMCLYIHKKREN